ncbi:MAG: MtrB/PioB family decaheme-associated outer membrane protein [Gammaproteobacteria bacterium]|jgi:MtrB/PioB family decaheme-associated outer membrane protein|nr:MtrB/PioB family decaheme-associated outer membrane protein [Gammaproteobacteria bacterium]MBP6050615.1 MtrB/PioB family decaheme-associated outer membrane protein [Pseudomonadales bacterium]MBK6583462.1 MtrB/PioB family decaheme-associated outer membrane protein [Gammaproteobacteria bacterium]MBK7168921.1 MtrB/PioB family decaheme-associated outer membrane protein [Gammaproteobacteria bacterium]MBK7521074.1 MtrB/PioB family decaheme-associated outer membrane protein [Gammaproteobacteria bac
MNSKHKALWLAILGASLGAVGVQAQEEFAFEDTSAPKAKPVYENHIELGGGYTDDGNGKFGEYTSGISDAYQDDGGFPVGSLHLGGSDPDAASSWDIKAGIGFGRLLEASYGVQGNYGLSLYADQVEKTEYGEARTVYPGGTPIARLPAGYVPGASSAAPAFYTGEDIGSKRSTFGLEGLKTLGEQWTVSFDLQRQDKTGDDVMGGNQGFSGTGLVPENINYSTDLMSARADYASRCLQTGLEVYLSQFDNDNNALPYENANYAPIGVEQLALEPDNQFLRVGIDGGWNFDMRTRLSWFADWSRGEQDDHFLPVVNDTNFYPTVNPVFPYSSLDGEVERTSLKLALVGRPTARLDYRLQYDYKDKDTRHDPIQTQLVSYSGSASDGYSNRIYDSERQTFAIEGGYRFASRVRLRGGIELETTDRDTDELDPLGAALSFTDSTDEDRYWVELKLPNLAALSVKLRAEYNVVEADLSDETEEFISPGGVGRRATPFFLLDRDQDVYKINADYALSDSVSLYGSFSVVRDDFNNDTYGLDTRDAEVTTVGLSWAASKAVSLSAYGSYEDYKVRQLGRQMGGTAVPYSEWKLDSEDNADAFGLTLDWVVVEDRFDLSMDFAYLESDSSYETNETYFGGITLVTGDTPDSNDSLSRLNIVGNYHFNDRIDVIGRYIYESRNAEDWAWSPDVVTAGTAAAVAFAYERPDYNSQAVMMSVRYKF